MMRFTVLIFNMTIAVLAMPLCATDLDQEQPSKRQSIPITPLFAPFPKALEMKQDDDTKHSVCQQKPPFGGVAITNSIPTWLYESALEDAPALVKGICYYWNHGAKMHRVSSCNRLILVGKPGTGKTTLARAIAWHLGYPIIFVNASRLLGKYRNQTAVNIRSTFAQFVEAKKPAIILIDELHKLFELHQQSEHSDDSVNAAAFWLALDEIEQIAPYLIVIGTANSVDSLPPEIKSRFQGKVVTISLPSKKQRVDAFLKILNHDMSIQVGKTVDRYYISSLLDKLQDQALRDVQLLIDTAKMCKYAEQPTQMPLLLEEKHFELALQQLKGESQVLQEGWSKKWIPKLKNTALMLSIAVHMGTVTRMIRDGSRYIIG